MIIKKALFYFLLIFSFLGGFMAHALFFPALLTNNMTVFAKRSLNKTSPPAALDTTNNALVHVVYEDGEFDPQVVVVRKSYYLGIMNNSSKELMTLTSPLPLLQTRRGYGLSEEHLVQLYNVGEYTVSSLLHPDKVLKVIVK